MYVYTYMYVYMNIYSCNTGPKEMGRVLVRYAKELTNNARWRLVADSARLVKQKLRQ